MLELNPYKSFHNDLLAVETASSYTQLRQHSFVKIDRTSSQAKTGQSACWQLELSQIFSHVMKARSLWLFYTLAGIHALR